MQTPIVFCADKNYGAYLPPAIQSIIENSSAEHEYTVIIFDCGMAAADIAVLERQIAEHENFRLKTENIAEQLKQRGLAAKDRWSAAMYGRFAIPDLCGDCGRVLYADADMIFERDIAELARADLGDDYIAAAPDIGMALKRRFKNKSKCYARETLGLADNIAYVNSGLLVFNISAWRENGLAEKCLDFVSRHRLDMPDQDAINSICAGHIVYLGQEWNCQHFWREQWDWENILRTGSGGIAEMLGAWRRVNAARQCVFHYDEPIKPWHDLTAPKNRLWLRYAEKAGIAAELLARAGRSRA